MPATMGGLGLNPVESLSKEELEKPVTVKQYVELCQQLNDLHSKFQYLCGHLGLEVSENRDKFRVIDYRNRRGMDQANCCAQELSDGAKKPSRRKFLGIF